MEGKSKEGKRKKKMYTQDHTLLKEDIVMLLEKVKEDFLSVGFI